MSGDLFSDLADERRRETAPLAARMRPTKLQDVVGQGHLLGQGKPLRALVDTKMLQAVLLWGPPGVGKTTLARLLAEALDRAFVPLSAVTAGVAQVRAEIEAATQRMGEQNRQTLVFVDEVHRFSKSQQDVLLPAIEEGVISFVGATTENPYHSVNPAILSRCVLCRLNPLDQASINELLSRSEAFTKMALMPGAVKVFVDDKVGDARAVLSRVEVAAAIAKQRGVDKIEEEDAIASFTAAPYRGGDDEHYDLASALIKSMRASDPDAAVYWLARALASGEDPRFLARRIMIFASEDVGLADPTAILVAEAASRAVDTVGLPEAALNLSHAVLHNACAPKSPSSSRALWAAQADIEANPHAEIPPILRDSHYTGASKLGHGVGYVSPHDLDLTDEEPRQSLLPETMRDRRYFEPSGNGREAAFRKQSGTTK